MQSFFGTEIPGGSETDRQYTGKRQRTVSVQWLWQHLRFHRENMPQRGDKPFKSKNFSAALGVSRVSFAPEEKIEEMMGNKVGATTIFGALMDPEQKIQVVMDKEVADSEWYGCSDGVTTGYMKLKTKDVLEKVLNYAKHEPKIIELACE